MNDLLKIYDAYFSQNNFMGDLKHNSIFSFYDKGSKICLSAPHSTKTFVCKQTKACDLYTGAITRYLGEQYNLSYIVRNKFINNKELISDFVIQNNLQNLTLLDIHGMKDNPDFDLAIGTGYKTQSQYKKELVLIKKLAKKYNISYTINHPSFTGRIGLTGRLQKHSPNTLVLQLEFSKTLRDFYIFPEIVQNKTLPFLHDLATNLGE